MNKRFKTSLTVSIILIFIIIWLFSGLLYFKSQQIDSKTNIQVETQDISNNNEKSNIDEAQSKIDILRKRLSFKWLIQDGDMHFQNKEYTRALVKYLEVNKKTPDDQSIINKIWNIYYSLNRYNQAYKYYSQIIDYSQLNQHRAIKSLFFSEDIKLNNLEKIKWEIALFNISETEKFYYNNSLECTKDFHECRKKFHEYFKNRENPTEAWSWEIIVTDGIIFDELENINNAIQNYENFQYDDLSYKAALISWAYFENWLYPIAIATSEDILKESPDYRPLIKIIARSYYEMWKYIEAKKFLIQYNWLWDNEPEISYFLWIIHQKLREYTRSTIQLRKSLKLWFENSIDVKRRLIFNYYNLWDSEKMLNIFSEMINENMNQITDQDISLAIFYNILYDKIEIANDFTSIALEKFPESDVFYAYTGWILLQSENLTDQILLEADSQLQKWLAINNKSPMISLTLWQLEEKRNNKDKAFIYYKQTISLDKWGEYGKFAKTKLESLNIETE